MRERQRKNERERGGTQRQQDYYHEVSEQGAQP